MTAATDLQHAPWWLHAPTQRYWPQIDEPAALAGMVRALLDREGPAPAALTVARAAMAELETCFAGPRAERDERLRALWLRHDPTTIAATQRIAVPIRLWERLLDRLDAGKTSIRRCWLSTSEQEGMFHQGVALGTTTEWWGLPEAPGATYDDRLWAWGAVQQADDDADSLGALSARLVWHSDGRRWHLHPRLQRTLRARAQSGHQCLPRLADGPGYLLACIVDAMAEILGTAAYTSRDLAVLWATMLLPLLAPSIELDGKVRPGTGHGTGRGDLGAPSAPPDALLGGAPDYLQTLPFFMFHPHIQSAIVVLDRLCTLLLVEDHAGLHQVLAHLGRADDSAGAISGDIDPVAIRAATFGLITDMAEQVLHRRAAARWDSGFGFKLFRKLLRDVLSAGAVGFARQWDAVVHGGAAPAPGHDVGALAQRLREALSTALWFPGRPPYPGGPAVQQLLDLTWLRWTDEDFLTT